MSPKIKTKIHLKPSKIKSSVIKHKYTPELDSNQSNNSNNSNKSNKSKKLNNIKHIIINNDNDNDNVNNSNIKQSPGESSPILSPQSMKKINITNDLNITNKTKSPSSEIEEYAYDVDVLKHLSETLENNSPKIKFPCLTKSVLNPFTDELLFLCKAFEF